MSLSIRDAFKALEDVQDDVLNEEIVEEDVYKLYPRYDSRQSFYNKAHVDERPDGSLILISYSTPVAKIKDGKVTLGRRWACSQTTLRHVKEFLKQNGFKAESSKQMMNDYPVERYLESCNEDLDDREPEKKEIEKISIEDYLDKFHITVDEEVLEQVKNYTDLADIIDTAFIHKLEHVSKEDLEKGKEEIKAYFDGEEVDIDLSESPTGIYWAFDEEEAYEHLDDCDESCKIVEVEGLNDTLRFVEIPVEEEEIKVDRDFREAFEKDEEEFNDSELTMSDEKEEEHSEEEIVPEETEVEKTEEEPKEMKVYKLTVLDSEGSSTEEKFKSKLEVIRKYINVLDSIPEEDKEKVELKVFKDEEDITEPVKKFLTESKFFSKIHSEKKSLTESEVINLNDDKDLEKAKEILNDEPDNIEKIVDVDAETVTELKDSYIGNVILQCPVCKTLVYKKPDALVQDEDNEELYNVGETCPHCGAEDGYELVGQVASMETEVEETETTGKEEVKDNENEDELHSEELPVEEKEEEEEITFESLDRESFDTLVNRYAHNIYENVKDYKTTNQSLEDDKIIVEGLITFNSGKSKNTKFVFESHIKTLSNKYKFKGLNETFSKQPKSFLLTTTLDNKTLVCESLSYNYTVKVLNESKKVRGKVNTLKEIIK